MNHLHQGLLYPQDNKDMKFFSFTENNFVCYNKYFFILLGVHPSFFIASYVISPYYQMKLTFLNPTYGWVKKHATFAVDKRTSK